MRYMSGLQRRFLADLSVPYPLGAQKILIRPAPARAVSYRMKRMQLLAVLYRGEVIVSGKAGEHLTR